MAYSYDRFIKLAKSKIDKFGGPVYLHTPIDGKVNSGTGQITYNQLTTAVNGIVLGYSLNEVNDNSILEEDRKVIIDSYEGKPQVNNTITVDGDEFRILEVDEMNPGVNQPILYMLHVRSTTIAEDLDGYITTLRGLELGDIVVDPENPRDYPKWVKVANDHHEQGITTLVEFRPYYLKQWDVGEPYEGKWIDTDLYKWLNLEFLNRLTVQLNGLLQYVPIETQGFTIDDKISLLSKEELDGTYTGGGSSGRQIDYFDSTIARIALLYDDLDNIEWWTRSHVSNSVAATVSTEGVLGEKATSNYYYVRAMIFLQDAQQVKLEDDGSYKLLYQ